MQNMNYNSLLFIVIVECVLIGDQMEWGQGGVGWRLKQQRASNIISRWDPQRETTQCHFPQKANEHMIQTLKTLCPL